MHYANRITVASWEIVDEIVNLLAMSATKSLSKPCYADLRQVPYELHNWP